MKQLQLVAAQPLAAEPQWKRYSIDTLLAMGGILLSTVVITTTHLYPRIPTISFMYLLAVLIIATLRGPFAAILASFLAFGAYLYFLVPPLYTFLVPRVQDLFTLVVFL